MTNPLGGKRVLLGVTGSIACYKAVDLASKLTQSGAQVDVILSQAAMKFITPLTFQSVTGRKAYTDDDLWGGEGHIVHIGLARGGDLFVVAPASANTLAKLAHGIADNLLTVTALAVNCPVLIAPAMDGGMYSHKSTQRNLEILHHRGTTLLGPTEGHLASGSVGIGRMLEPAILIGHIRLALSQNGALTQRKIIVTAGGTQEAIDPVRVVMNRSSGKQGFALAQAALDLGAQVRLIAGPTQLETPIGALRVDVRSADEMLTAVLAELPGSDVLLMAAAVADFKPAYFSDEKIKKEDAAGVINLEATPDILASVAEYRAKNGVPHILVGFAAESRDLLENAKVKLRAKNLDMIVANDITADDAGFAVDQNRVSLIDKDGKVEALPLMPKTEVAEIVVGRVAEWLTARGKALD